MKQFFLLTLFLTFSLSLLYLFGQKPKNLVSPILGISKIQLANNLWFPQDSHFGVKTVKAELNITASSAFFVETHTGEVLYEKEPHQRLPIASLAKIMTVIISLENKDWNDVMVVSQQAADMEPDKMLLKSDEKLTVEELVDGVFTVSANDGAEVLAKNSVGSREEFIRLMNEKALQLGMKDTKFINPTGLEEDPSTVSTGSLQASSGQATQYSTTFDMALMSRYAIKTWPHLVDISSQPHIYLPETSTHQDYDLYSGINLLTTYPGVVGFKTGYTPEAGLTLVTLARKGGHEVLGVILGATNRRDDARELLDYSFKKLGVN